MSYPINQVFLGSDPMGSGLDDLDAQIRKMEAYRNKLRQMQSQQQPQKLIWDEIDAEIIPMTEEQKARLLQDPEYAEVYTDLQNIVQSEILNLVKGRIESTERGKELLSKQLRIVKKLKNKIISETNREMELFNRFREYSKQHPEVTYEEFIKASL
nr:MAG TPA: hypothetical protein [Crassvirales sp.]